MNEYLLNISVFTSATNGQHILAFLKTLLPVGFPLSGGEIKDIEIYRLLQHVDPDGATFAVMVHFVATDDPHTIAGIITEKLMDKLYGRFSNNGTQIFPTLMTPA